LHSRAYLYLTVTALVWGANAVAGKLAVGHISPLLLTSLRWLFAFVFILAFAVPHLKRDMAIIRANAWLLFAFGAFGFTGFNATLYLALNYTSTINAVIEQAGMPLIIFLANFLLFRIAVTWLQMVGFLLTLIGVAVTVSNGDLATLFSLKLNRGDALMMLAILFYGGYTAALRFKPPIHWMSFMTVLCAAAFVASLPLTAMEAAAGAMIPPDRLGWTLMLFTAIFPSLLAQALYIRGNELIGGNRAGLFVNLVPIFGTVLAVIVLGERLYAFHILGLALVLGGIALAEKGKPKAA
jgi:drug/metabolite transporter (DMT)-like permease